MCSVLAGVEARGGSELGGLKEALEILQPEAFLQTKSVLRGARRVLVGAAGKS